MKLGKLEQITDLRSIWKHEAKDFTPWLAKEENLAILSEAVGIDIVLDEQESSVGDFSVDLFATEDGTTRRIIIENQLEDTNHDHLGKIITYASGKDADVIIWIVKKARDEHRQAIEWLNQHTDSTISFFLIEIALWKIDNSAPAPIFNIVERPNDWAKAMKTASATEASAMKMEFWNEFNKHADTNPMFVQLFKLRKPHAQHWYDLAVGSSDYHVCVTVHSQKKYISTGLYIDDDKELYQIFKDHADEIESMIGLNVEWREANKASRFLVTKPFDICKREDWEKAISWMYDMCLKVREVVKKYDK